jgi:hypothetical protein
VPTIIQLSTNGTLVKKLEYLRTELGLTSEETVRVVTAMPTLLTLSVEKGLRPKVEFLRTSFAGDDTKLRDTVMRLPALLGYSLEQRIIPRMERVIGAGFQASKISVVIPMGQSQFDEWIARRQKETGGEEQALLVTPPCSVDTIAPGPPRIQHWTRARRPLGQCASE